MEIIKLSKDYNEQLINLINITVQNLEKPEWLIALTKEELEKIWTNPKVIIYGAVDNGKLLAISGLFFDESDYLDIMKLLNIENNKVVEIAECMTLPSARGNNLMLKINTILIQEAQKLGFDYIIATAHPDNISSNKSLQKLGMESNVQFLRYGKYIRNCYMLKI